MTRPSNLLQAVRNPFYVTRGIGARDSAILWHDGVLHCFYTGSYQGADTYFSHIEHLCTRDFVTWERCPDVVSDPPIFWSVGNVIRVKDEWVLCMQDYRVPPGEKWAGDDARLWITKSPDLMKWGTPISINPGGCNVRWRPTRRQVDPFIVEHDGRYWCFYKGGGLGLLVSDDLLHWREASVDRPVFAPADTPDGSSMENPCVVRAGGEFVLFFSPNRKQRGIGMARSTDLIRWRDSRYLEFPKRSWMLGRGVPNAAMVIDVRADLGVWLMVFHSDDDEKVVHSGVLGLAWSENLTDWSCP
jgi:sucrose-6-phosphate hydrolase SacC (GH32 family)